VDIDDGPGGQLRGICQCRYYVSGLKVWYLGTYLSKQILTGRYGYCVSVPCPGRLRSCTQWVSLPRYLGRYLHYLGTYLGRSAGTDNVTSRSTLAAGRTPDIWTGGIQACLRAWAAPFESLLGPAFRICGRSSAQPSLACPLARLPGIRHCPGAPYPPTNSPDNSPDNNPDNNPDNQPYYQSISGPICPSAHLHICPSRA
jgi:hypothetical protein